MCEEGFADAVDHIIKESLASDFGDFHAGQFPRAHSQKTHSDPLFRVARMQFISGNLFSDKLVVRLVVVKRSNNVVAISPCITSLVVIGKPLLSA